jgi:hypothetical protein
LIVIAWVHPFLLLHRATVCHFFPCGEPSMLWSCRALSDAGNLPNAAMSEQLSIAGDGTVNVPLVKHLLRRILTVLQGLKLSGLVRASQNCQDGGPQCPIKNNSLGSLLRIRSISCNRKGMGGCVFYSLTTVVAILHIAGYAMLCYANKTRGKSPRNRSCNRSCMPPLCKKVEVFSERRFPIQCIPL